DVPTAPRPRVAAVDADQPPAAVRDCRFSGAFPRAFGPQVRAFGLRLRGIFAPWHLARNHRSALSVFYARRTQMRVANEPALLIEQDINCAVYDAWKADRRWLKSLENLQIASGNCPKKRH